MPPYEFAFEVSPLSEEVEDSVTEQFDTLISSHGASTKVTLTAEGPTCVEAAARAVEVLRGLGVEVLRLVDDLVTRSDVAQRIGVTTQAVSNWIHGARNSAVAFPQPFVAAGATLWLWGEVLEYLRRTSTPVEDELRYPTRRDIQLIGGAIAASSSPATTQA